MAIWEVELEIGQVEEEASDRVAKSDVVIKLLG
jgi:hypothetical protein